jgi:hypothetical protein
VQNKIDGEIFILMLRHPWAKNSYLDRASVERVLIHPSWRKIKEGIEDKTPDLEPPRKRVRQIT